MERRTPLSKYALRNRPSRKWYYYVGVATGLSGLGGIIALGGFIVLRSAGENVPTDTLVLQAVLSIIGVFVFVLTQSQAREVENPFLDQNDLDFEAGRAIQAAISTMLSGPTPITDHSVPGTRVYQRLKLGEIIRQVDSQASTLIEAWLDQRLGVGEFGLGLQVSRLDFGGSAIDIGRQRVKHMADGSGDSDNPAGGLVVILEQEVPQGVVDTVRVIIPSESDTRAYVGQFVASLGKAFGEGSYRDGVLAGSAHLLQRCLVNDIDYVCDRLYAILRMPPESRPTLTIVGAEVTAHAIIGGAIQFGEDKNLYQLFPVGLIQRITDTIVQTACRTSP